MPFMRRSYVYKKSWKRRLAAALDWAGDFFYKRKTQRSPSVTRGTRFLIIRWDHLGDVISILPLLKTLKAGPSKPYVAVSVSSAGAVLLRDTPWVDHLLPFDAPWFCRPYSAGTRRSWRAWVKHVQTMRFDIGLDLRGDVRHHCLMALARIPYRAGYGITGGGFLLNDELLWNSQAHAVDLNLSFLKVLGMALPQDRTPQLMWRAKPEELAWLKQTIKGSRPFVAFHAEAGTPAKRWPLAHWAALLSSGLLEGRWPVLIGSDAAIGKRLLNLAPKNSFLDLTGKTSLPQLVTLLQQANAVLSTDSGPAHIAAALGRPTFVFWSGVTSPQNWAPRGLHSAWTRQDVPCQPCGLEVCPLERHVCMETLVPQDVVPRVRAFLAS